MVDNPLDEGRHQELVVTEIRDIFRDGKGNVGVAGVIRNSLERDRSGGEHRWRRYRDLGRKQTKAAMADCCDFFPAVKSLEHKSGAYSCYALRAEDEESLSFALFIVLRKGVR